MERELKRVSCMYNEPMAIRIIIRNVIPILNFTLKFLFKFSSLRLKLFYAGRLLVNFSWSFLRSQ